MKHTLTQMVHIMRTCNTGFRLQRIFLKRIFVPRVLHSPNYFYVCVFFCILLFLYFSTWRRWWLNMHVFFAENLIYLYNIYFLFYLFFYDLIYVDYFLIKNCLITVVVVVISRRCCYVTMFLLSSSSSPPSLLLL